MKTPTFNAAAISEHIIDWLKNYAEQAGVRGFVIGISGGIDSAVTSTLCARTGLPTLCLEMPIHQAESQVSRGREHLEFLKAQFPNVQTDLADLTATFEVFQQALPAAASPADDDVWRLTLANTRARLRMTTLYYFAGMHRALVVGTGNKIEDFGVGFFTKYGDGGVDLSPIADLLKSEVRQLGHFLNVPSSIIQAKPTDGLFGDDRSDEDQLGANYDELEKAMHASDQGLSAADLSGRDREVFEIYKRLNRINQHKIQPIPVCIIPENLKK
ncbi:NAD(+) synthase [Flavobacterium sp. JP2137]|uniref:NAD(+) synthase n=1 Tax=Flavobacterium sp. JP2137 TaxID=3414510 RepID=UPI003D2FC800